jgi:dUTP pyrophosphatase
MKIRVKLLHPDAMPPMIGMLGDIAIDLYCLHGTHLLPYHMEVIGTGISIETEGYGFIVKPRSSMVKKGILVEGVIDSGYRGEIFINAINTSTSSYKIEKRDRIAQLIPIKAENFEVEIVEGNSMFLPTIRGDSGYGSTGR